jgi:hypothetical protein
VPTTVVSVVGSLLFCLLSYTEHVYSVQPSLLLNAYLFVSLLFDIARARTLWLRDYNHYHEVIAIVFTASVGLKVVILVLEAIEKRWILRPQYKAYPPEAISGIYNRSFFWWLNPLFRRGFSSILFIEDLFTLDKHLAAEYLQERLQGAWDRGLSCLLCPFTLCLLVGFKLIVYLEISHEETSKLIACGCIRKPQMATFGSHYSSSMPHCTEFLPTFSYQQSNQVI